MVIDPAFWRGRAVFVTGHTGFKGGWLCAWLRALGSKVHGYALAPPPGPSMYCDGAVGRHMASSVIADIRDSGTLASAIGQAQPEIVFHLAAQPLVRHSYNAPLETFETNVMGTVHVLEAARSAGSVKAVVNVTTDKCYENREWPWGYRESDELGGYDPYSSSKACAELVTAAYRTSFLAKNGIFVATARAGNVIGGGDWAVERLVPDVIRAVIAGKPARIRNPMATRPWQHVLDPLSGYLALAQRLHQDGRKFSEAWNFGPAAADAKPVRDIVDSLTAFWGSGAHWEAEAGAHPHETHFLKLDCSKAHALLQWKPRLDIESALAWTVDWYKAWQQGRDMHEMSMQQISSYERLSAP